MTTRSSRRHFARQPRKGIALVLSLVLIVVLSATAAVALSMVGSERRVVEDQEAAAEAYAIARSAYGQFIANPTGSMAFNPLTFTGPDSAKFVFSDGYAWVSIQRIRPSINQSAILFLIRSRAVRTANRRSNTPVAERVFAQYAQWLTGTMPVPAAWTSLTGISKNGGSGTISGMDACLGANPVAGVGVPTSPGYMQNGGVYVPLGSPPIYDMGAQADANALMKLDWKGIVGGTSLTPDIVLPGGAWPSFADVNYWPVILVDQAADWTLPANGRGILIVRRNMIINGSVNWDGIILVGGSLTSNGNNTVGGVVFSGLNVLLGESVAVSSLGNGNKTYTYDSCKVALAAARFIGLSALRNTSADNWQSY